MKLKEAASIVIDNYLYESHNSNLMGHVDLKDLPIGVQNHIIQTLRLRPKKRTSTRKHGSTTLGFLWKWSPSTLCYRP